MKHFVKGEVSLPNRVNEGISAEVEEDRISDTCNNIDLGWDDGRRIVELRVLAESLAMCDANDCNEHKAEKGCTPSSLPYVFIYVTSYML